MIQAEILDARSGVKVTDVFIPENAKEIKYGQFIEFDIKSREIHQWIAEQKVINKKYDYQVGMKIADAVSSVLGVDKRILVNLKFKDQDWIWNAWSILHQVIATYKPVDNGGMIRVSGKWYKVPQATRSVIRDEVYADNMTCEQFYEIAYIEKRLSDVLNALDVKEKKEKVDTQDQRIQTVFTYTLMKIAVCLNDANTIPEGATFDKWLDEKVMDIYEISMEDGLNTIFFLSNTSKDLETLKGLDTILKLYQLGGIVERNISNIVID